MSSNISSSAASSSSAVESFLPSREIRSSSSRVEKEAGSFFPRYHQRDRLLAFFCEKGLVDKNGRINAEKLSAIPLPDLDIQASDRVFRYLNKTVNFVGKKGEFTIAGSIHCLLYYLLNLCSHSQSSAENIRIVGGAVPVLLGESWFSKALVSAGIECDDEIKQAIQTALRKSVPDYDIRIGVPKAPKKTLDYLKGGVEHCIGNWAGSGWAEHIKKYGLYKRKTVFDDANKYSVVSIGDDSSRIHDVLFVSHLARENLFESDYLSIPIHSLLRPESSLQTPIKLPADNLRGWQALFDCILGLTHIEQGETINIPGLMGFYSKQIQGKLCHDEKEVSSLLKAAEEKKLSVWEIKNIFTNRLLNHHADDPLASFALAFRCVQDLPEITDSESSEIFWESVRHDWKQFKDDTHPLAALSYFTVDHALSHDIITALVEMCGFIQLCFTKDDAERHYFLRREGSSPLMELAFHDKKSPCSLKIPFEPVKALETLWNYSSQLLLPENRKLVMDLNRIIKQLIGGPFLSGAGHDAPIPKHMKFLGIDMGRLNVLADKFSKHPLGVFRRISNRLYDIMSVMQIPGASSAVIDGRSELFSRTVSMLGEDSADHRIVCFNIFCMSVEKDPSRRMCEWLLGCWKEVLNEDPAVALRLIQVIFPHTKELYLDVYRSLTSRGKMTGEKVSQLLIDLTTSKRNQLSLYPLALSLFEEFPDLANPTKVRLSPHLCNLSQKLLDVGNCDDASTLLHLAFTCGVVSKNSVQTKKLWIDCCRAHMQSAPEGIIHAAKLWQIGEKLCLYRGKGVKLLADKCLLEIIKELSSSSSPEILDLSDTLILTLQKRTPTRSIQSNIQHLMIDYLCRTIDKGNLAEGVDLWLKLNPIKVKDEFIDCFYKLVDKCLRKPVNQRVLSKLFGHKNAILLLKKFPDKAMEIITSLLDDAIPRKFTMDAAILGLHICTEKSCFIPLFRKQLLRLVALASDPRIRKFPVFETELSKCTSTLFNVIRKEEGPDAAIHFIKSLSILTGSVSFEKNDAIVFFQEVIFILKRDDHGSIDTVCGTMGLVQKYLTKQIPRENLVEGYSLFVDHLLAADRIKEARHWYSFYLKLIEKRRAVGVPWILKWQEVVFYKEEISLSIELLEWLTKHDPNRDLTTRWLAVIDVQSKDHPVAKSALLLQYKKYLNHPSVTEVATRTVEKLLAIESNPHVWKKGLEVINRFAVYNFTLWEKLLNHFVQEPISDDSQAAVRLFLKRMSTVELFENPNPVKLRCFSMAMSITKSKPYPELIFLLENLGTLVEFLKNHYKDRDLFYVLYNTLLSRLMATNKKEEIKKIYRIRRDLAPIFSEHRYEVNPAIDVMMIKRLLHTKDPALFTMAANALVEMMGINLFQVDEVSRPLYVELLCHMPECPDAVKSAICLSVFLGTDRLAHADKSRIVKLWSKINHEHTNLTITKWLLEYLQKPIDQEEWRLHWGPACKNLLPRLCCSDDSNRLKKALTILQIKCVSKLFSRLELCNLWGTLLTKYLCCTSILSCHKRQEILDLYRGDESATSSSQAESPEEALSRIKEELPGQIAYAYVVTRDNIHYTWMKPEVERQVVNAMFDLFIACLDLKEIDLFNQVFLGFFQSMYQKSKHTYLEPILHYQGDSYTIPSIQFVPSKLKFMSKTLKDKCFSSMILLMNKLINYSDPEKRVIELLDCTTSQNLIYLSSAYPQKKKELLELIFTYLYNTNFLSDDIFSTHMKNCQVLFGDASVKQLFVGKLDLWWEVNLFLTLKASTTPRVSDRQKALGITNVITKVIRVGHYNQKRRGLLVFCKHHQSLIRHPDLLKYCFDVVIKNTFPVVSNRYDGVSSVETVRQILWGVKNLSMQYSHIDLSTLFIRVSIDFTHHYCQLYESGVLPNDFGDPNAKQVFTQPMMYIISLLKTASVNGYLLEKPVSFYLMAERIKKAIISKIETDETCFEQGEFLYTTLLNFGGCGRINLWSLPTVKREIPQKVKGIKSLAQALWDTALPRAREVAQTILDDVKSNEGLAEHFVDFNLD